MFIPNGRLSAVDIDGGTAQIQTEFAAHPRPRVTTTVIMDGRVLHKEERPWDVETESPEGQEQLEGFLRSQHTAIQNRVRSGEITVPPPQPEAAKEAVVMPKTPQPPARHPAGRTPGVLRLFIVSKSGELLAADDSGVPRPTEARLFTVAAEFIDFWEEVESERFAQMLTRDRDSNFLLVRHFGKYWGAELVPGADPDETLQAFLPALEQ